MFLHMWSFFELDWGSTSVLHISYLFSSLHDFTSFSFLRGQNLVPSLTLILTSSTAAPFLSAFGSDCWSPAILTVNANANAWMLLWTRRASEMTRWASCLWPSAPSFSWGPGLPSYNFLSSYFLGSLCALPRMLLVPSPARDPTGLCCCCWSLHLLFSRDREIQTQSVVTRVRVCVCFPKLSSSPCPYKPHFLRTVAARG